MINNIINLISPGLFEATARYLCFYILLKTNPINRDKKTSVSYGIGHGGIECMLLSIQDLIVIIDKEFAIENQILIDDITFLDCLIYCIVRSILVIVHISFSVLVFKAINEKKILFYILAIIIHDFIDLFGLLYLWGIINIHISELIVTFIL